jgi:hypothetical protein
MGAGGRPHSASFYCAARVSISPGPPQSAPVDGFCKPPVHRDSAAVVLFPFIAASRGASGGGRVGGGGGGGDRGGRSVRRADTCDIVRPAMPG